MIIVLTSNGHIYCFKAIEKWKPTLDSTASSERKKTETSILVHHTKKGYYVKPFPLFWNIGQLNKKLNFGLYTVMLLINLISNFKRKKKNRFPFKTSDAN